MKIQIVLPAILAMCVFAVLPSVVQADFFSAATDSVSDTGPGDLAGDVTKMFAVNTENARNLADVYGNCVENPQEGNWQGDPRRRQERPVDYDYDYPRTQGDDHSRPSIMLMSNSPTPQNGGKRTNDDPQTDIKKVEDEETPNPPTTPVTPEPGTMILLGLGAAGLLPLSFRKQKRS